MKKIRKILIANRGEIAVRIINAASELGIITVAIYSGIDRLSMHVSKADEAYLVTGSNAAPYLDIDQIINVARGASVDAVHPGYGFLSENPLFAQKLAAHGIVFIGPSHHTMDMMGDKVRAKELAVRSEVPVIPGFEIRNGLDTDEIENAKNLGFPLLLKASAGGGGKGMRIVETTEQLQELIAPAVREAEEAFGDGKVFLEKYIEKPRHIEIQVLADNHGNIVHLFERECSIQRRHQKIIEEAPSSVLDHTLRKKMGEAALKISRNCNYTNAGTVEFVVDQEKKFYFLEMNTRLQVEHPVTEFISRLDLVKLQISIAEGKPLPFSAEDLQIGGHAIELRVYAEDPENFFLPDTGTLTSYRTPEGLGVRVDNGYMQGMEIPVEYDPLIAKLIVHGRDRQEAISRMKRAIRDYHIVGVRNTLEFGYWVMDSKAFVEGNFNTSFIEENMDDFKKRSAGRASSMIAALAGAIFVDNKGVSKINNKPILQSKWRQRMK